MLALKELIENLLDDDEGISSEAYSSLLNYLATINEPGLIEEVNNQVKSANGRYYFQRGPEWQTMESWADCKKANPCNSK
jgi:hypothetical protein